MGYSAKQKKVSSSVHGAKRLAEELKKMGENAKDILSKAASVGGQIALEDAIRNCPVRTGALRDSLKIQVTKQSETKAEVTIDYDKSLRYGTFVELGARGKPANPFLRSAVDNNIQKINEAITESVVKGVDDAL